MHAGIGRGLDVERRGDRIARSSPASTATEMSVLVPAVVVVGLMSDASMPMAMASASCPIRTVAAVWAAARPGPRGAGGSPRNSRGKAGAGKADASGRANQMGLSPGRVRFIGSRCHSLPSLPFLRLSLSFSRPSFLPPLSPARLHHRLRRADLLRPAPAPPPQIRPRPSSPPARTPGLRCGSHLPTPPPHRRPALDGRPPPPPRSRSLPVALLLRGPTPCDSRDPLTAASAGDCCSWIGGQRRSALGTAARM
ncbi:hypothetical protein ZWY2020_037544 [Hordeum vulgare]|nr:hypothetical protein ZWY2020_037544 [Hordeum vulgare]